MLNTGLYPAVIKSYNPAMKTCEVVMDGVTSGANGSIIAKIAFPIGDKGQHTDIRILAGDTVWVMFEGGDMRHPIITHYRNHESGNAIDWRKFHHANIEMTADGVLVITAPIIQINGNITHTGNQTTSGNMSVGGTMSNMGTDVGSTHTHPQNDGNDNGGGTNTGTPN